MMSLAITGPCRAVLARSPGRDLLARCDTRSVGRGLAVFIQPGRDAVPDSALRG